MRRPTIRDIAKIAQVSPGAVSLALNDKPGVSQETRDRIVEVAKSIGWIPSAAAKALSSAKASSVGLVLGRPRASIDAENFYFRFICGVEQVLTKHDQAFLLQLVEDVQEELEVYRDWWARRRVDAVILVDPRREDPRPKALASLGLPYVCVGTAFPDAKAVVVDDETMPVALSHLAEQNCRSVAYVCGLPSLHNTISRIAAFHQHAKLLGLEGRVSNYTNYSEDAGAQETTTLIASANRPDAIIYDNDILAVGGLSAMKAHDLQWPHDIAVLSLEDSPVCRVFYPQITAFRRDPSVLGFTAADLLLHGAPGQVKLLPSPELNIRASTQRN